MATDKSKISSYVDSDLYSRISAQAEENGLSVSNHVAQLLQSTFETPTQEPQPGLSVPLPREVADRLEEIAQENGLTSSILLGMIATQIANGKRSLWPESQPTQVPAVETSAQASEPVVEDLEEILYADDERYEGPDEEPDWDN